MGTLCRYLPPTSPSPFKGDCDAGHVGLGARAVLARERWAFGAWLICRVLSGDKSWISTLVN